MSLLWKLLTLPVTGPIDAALWTARQIAERAEDVYYDDKAIRAALMELELKYDLGEIDLESFEAEETALMIRRQENTADKSQQAEIGSEG